MNRAVVSVGSNISPERNIAAALRLLSKQVRVLGAAPVCRTTPLGKLAQPDFLNGAWLVETTWDRDMLKEQLRRIEDTLGRIRGGDKWGPRTIDLDIVVWNGRIVDEDVYERPFLAEAVKTLLPELSPELTALWGKKADGKGRKTSKG